MKQKVGPVAIVIAVVVVVAFVAVLYQTFFPPMPKSDLDNPKGMPMYAQNYLKKRKAGANTPPSGGAVQQAGAQQSVGSTPLAH